MKYLSSIFKILYSCPVQVMFSLKFLYLSPSFSQCQRVVNTSIYYLLNIFSLCCLLFYIKSNKLCQHEKKVLITRTVESTLRLDACILINTTQAKTNKKHHRPNKVRKQRMESEEEGKKIKKRGGKKDMD